MNNKTIKRNDDGTLEGILTMGDMLEQEKPTKEQAEREKKKAEYEKKLDKGGRCSKFGA